jgi:cytoplasmic iron level regulating protein YaaA (DUF328/UPF0246 family)
MKISGAMAAKVHRLMANWDNAPTQTLPAINAFIGDIYSGLQVQSFSDADRQYANDCLYILSGIYGVLRALDAVQPYRLEMGYRLPDEPYRNLYKFWGDRIANALPSSRTIINLSAVEYTKAVFPHLSNPHIITPKFLTVSPRTSEPTFVTVHAKVARGAFAHWLIKNRIESIEDFTDFNELNYRYELQLSTPDEPVYVCKEFGGIGMSVRLKS